MGPASDAKEAASWPSAGFWPSKDTRHRRYLPTASVGAFSPAANRDEGSVSFRRFAGCLLQQSARPQGWRFAAALSAGNACLFSATAMMSGAVLAAHFMRVGHGDAIAADLQVFIAIDRFGSDGRSNRRLSYEGLIVRSQMSAKNGRYCSFSVSYTERINARQAGYHHGEAMRGGDRNRNKARLSRARRASTVNVTGHHRRPFRFRFQHHVQHRGGRSDNA